MFKKYCLLTGGSCPHIVEEKPNSIFLSEPYSPEDERTKREESVKEGLKGYDIIIADKKTMNIIITCKICQMIQSVQYGIVDLTCMNPNVLIELGMLYGFCKPSILMVKQEFARNHISNSLTLIKGIEFFSYSELKEIPTELEKRMKNLLELKEKSATYLQGLRAIFEYYLQKFEIFLESKKVHYIEGEVVSFVKYGLDLTAIINLGRNKGIVKGMQFRLFRKDKLIAPMEYLEEPVGCLQISYPQERMSQARVLYTDPSNEFWRDTLNNTQNGFFIPPKNMVRVYLPEDVESLSIDELNEYCESIKNIISIRMM